MQNSSKIQPKSQNPPKSDQKAKQLTESRTSFKSNDHLGGFYGPSKGQNTTKGQNPPKRSNNEQNQEPHFNRTTI